MIRAIAALQVFISLKNATPATQIDRTEKKIAKIRKKRPGKNPGQKP
jgi:hypothetical protein